MTPIPNSFPRLPAAPRPPHDPTFWLLNARTGWHDAALDKLTPSADAVVLSVVPGSGRVLNEPSGSFGGLKLPGNVALADDGSLWLLDSTQGRLKRFDPCACQFVTVPCLGGAGTEPRQVSAPHALGIYSGNLFLCDTGNHRVSVFSLRGMALRVVWLPPASAALAAPWQPYGIAFDARSRVYVSDAANGCIHRFSPTGRWQKKFDGFGGVTWIAIDCSNRLYAVITGADSVRITDLEAASLSDSSRPEEAADLFPPLPFHVDSYGSLHLGPCCSPPRQPGVFDLGGNPVPSPPKDPPLLFETSGTFWSEPLDSHIYRCQWHRVVLSGEVPRKTAIFVSTFTSEVEQTLDQIQALPESAWKSNALILPMNGNWDWLIFSGPGRYLWLRVRLSGSGAASPCIRALRIEYPRISLTRYLPAVFDEDPRGAEFSRRFLSIFDTGFRSIESTIDQAAGLFDPLSAPAEPGRKDFLSWLASWIGVSLDRKWTVQQRRRFLKLAGSLQAIRGTRFGLRQQLLILLGMQPEEVCCPSDQPKRTCVPKPLNCAPPPKDCVWEPPPLILENYQLRRWLFVGSGTLGDNAVLWGRRIVNRSRLGSNAQAGGTQLKTTPDPLHDPFLVYAHKFTVFVPSRFGAVEKSRRSLINLLESEKPAHTQYQVEYVAPRMRIGFQSMIGLDSVVGRYPAGFHLGEKLGPASVLSGSPVQEAGKTYEIGQNTRLGPAVRLG
jgi:phage tail-like protein